MRFLYFVLGILCLGLGIIGAFLPVMPTTIFVILAAGCFAKCSPRLENWILDHPRFGPAVKSWRLNRSMSSRAKIAASTGMALGGLAVAITPMSVGGKASCWALIGACLVYVLTRPTASALRERQEERMSLGA